LLLERGYRITRFTEAVRSPADGKVAAITFDDAFRSVFEYGFPILRRLGVPATLFVPTDYIDADAGFLDWPGIDAWRHGPAERELVPMSWSEIGELADAGWEIGSHTGSHPHLTQIDAAALADELVRSKAECERQLSRPCPSVAYPYGDLDGRVVAAAARAGYITAAALPDKLDARDPMQWPRVGVYHVDDDRRFRLKVSPALIALRSSPAWDGLAALSRRRR
jgi:peptidoglycan/xylan/chitin deacetylase (PgdA/CDA1 family)